MVHWVGEGSDVIICLARDPTPTIPSIPINPSNVYISYDYGDTYENKTHLFKLPDGSYSTVEKFYNHPKYNTHVSENRKITSFTILFNIMFPLLFQFVFTDVKNKQLFVTTNHGRNITRLNVSFTPSEVSFHEYQPQTFLVLHKSEQKQQVCILLASVINL